MVFGILRRKREKRGPLVYLSEPTILYHTQTEKLILEIIEEKLDSTNVIVPSDYGIKDVSDRIAEAEYLVAVAIYGKFSSLVCREVEKARSYKKRIYTIDIASKKDDEITYYFEEGVPEHIEWLNEEETREFFDRFLGDDFIGMSFRGFFLGYRKKTW
ncbi:hypothetical protein [Pyrococcus sp. ST04]|uniref:hypothetical protein n=1 Tax=Pyrococcus sp. ST04 TaxID=1183377 RepID=UPI0002605E5A|nr:hypothetical protein [Pyrococcus sp. ST04]AFK22573.1 hypothetical protein Py04_0991 [Pyrococcus sp. ST04]